jgi:hypothetical protein
VARRAELTGLFAAGLAALALGTAPHAKTERWSFAMSFSESAGGFQVSVGWPKAMLEVNRATGAITLVGSKPSGAVHASTGSCTNPSGPVSVAASAFPYKITGKVTLSGFRLVVKSVAVVHASSSDPTCNDNVHETAEVLDPTLKTIELPIVVRSNAKSALYRAGPVDVTLKRIA